MNKKTNTHIQQGEIVIFSTGSYSDYSRCGEMIFIKSCNFNDCVRQYLREVNPEREDYLDRPEGLPGWLVANGYCLPLDNREVYLADYSRFEPEFIARGEKP